MDKKIRVGINGFGRIGRAALKIALEKPELEIVAVNDLGDLENICYLLKYDSVYGRFDKEIEINKEEEYFTIEGKKVIFLKQPDPAKLPWKDLDIDVVIESTGVFSTFEKSKAHLEAGAKRVVISSPAKDDDLSMNLGATVLLGTNEDKFGKTKITSNASCTTCAVAPVTSILLETVGIKKAMLNTTHSYTASQNLVDGPSKKDWRRGRAGASNIVLTTTGAAKAVGQAIEEMKNFDGISVRVPTITVSLADLTFVASRETTAEEIKDIFKKAVKDSRWQGVVRVEEDPIVSSDIIGDKHMGVIDLSFTRVVGGDLVKVLIWYDNEWGYSNGLIEHAIKVGKL